MTESKPDQGGQQWPGASAWPQDGQAAWPDPGQSAWPQAGQPAWPDPNQEQPGQGVEHQAQGPQGWPGAPGAWSAQPQGQQDPRAAHGGHQPAWDQDAAGQQGRTGQVPQPSPYAFPGQPQPAQDPSHAYPQQGYDPSQGYPQQGGWDQQQAYDPNQAYHQQGHDPVHQGGWDQQQGYDPSQQGGWDQQPEAPRGGEFQGFDQSGGFGPEFNTGVWQHDDFDPMSPSVDNLNLISSPGNRGPGIGRRLRDAFGRQGPRDDLQYRTLVNRINQPIQGDYRIAILSLKGGVGKTTTTVGLGSTFASLRGDRVIAVDANPDLGTLGSRIPRQSNSTVRDLLVDTSIYRYSDVRAHTSQSSSRLEVLASERDPAISEAFSERDYRGVIKILQRFYNVILTDCGTGLMHSAMKGVLDLAHALVLVTSPALDGARSAGATLDWLLHHGYDQLVARTVVVVSSSRPGSPTLDLNQLRQHFLVRCRAVQIIPFDDHLSEGAEIELDQLHRSTRRSFVELAALIADDFPMAMSRQQRSQY
ncbi:AAA family ATPase [Segniliparus rugosus]|uniref:nucleotide-binding protein n=1 Tax=Segniliparus rugosus TaxID=286804 RepID=UPI001FCC7BB7|nr:MinD/ParA family protein [Segniliparus rugosus]